MDVNAKLNEREWWREYRKQRAAITGKKEKGRALTTTEIARAARATTKNLGVGW